MACYLVLLFEMSGHKPSAQNESNGCNTQAGVATEIQLMF
jgi:hypothetical protein